MVNDLTTTVREFFAERFGEPQLLDMTIKSMTENNELYFATEIKNGVGVNVESFGEKLGEFVNQIRLEREFEADMAL